jgi:hypothetical protein
MLALVPEAITRRQLILGAVTALAASACARVPERAEAPSTPIAAPELEAWRREAASLARDGLQALREFEVFTAYRVSTTSGSDRRSASELVWDPPSGADWDAATHVSRSLRSRADQLFQSVTTAQVDASIWREQRELADIAHGIGDVGDALAAYRDRIDSLRPGDATGALALLNTAWGTWEQTAGRLGLARAEAIGCAT